jgi:uncharacterized membrane protein YkvA (DUF1232 family)
MMGLGRLKAAARRIGRDVMTVYFAARDPRTPLLIRLLALAIAAYALSPIDLIPDFIPVIGLLDEVVLLPLGIVLIIRLTPAAVIESSREKARDAASRPTSKVAAAVIIAIWGICVAGFGYWLSNALRS